MLELAFKGNRHYWIWLSFLGIGIITGTAAYLVQFNVGLAVTGLSRDVSWGFYLAQLTFLVGVAASAVMVVLPYYLHNFRVFGRITILGEFTAIAAVCMCGLFLFVDIGQPMRAMNVFLYPSPKSIVFWDATVLNGYLFLNLIVGWNVLEAERNGVQPPFWVKPLIYLSIPWAFAIHTVTAFIYCGLGGRGFWLTAIMAPRFLASAFSSGPAFLIIICRILRKVSGFNAGTKAIQGLAKIATYGLMANLFFLSCEIFVVYNSGLPEHKAHFQYLYFGLDGHGVLVPWMRTALILMVSAAILLIIPATRRHEPVLITACVALFTGTWIDKGMGLVTGGFIPTPLHQVLDYVPTVLELLISVGIYATGALILTILLKLAMGVKKETGRTKVRFI
ncbi:MAG: polysulfide reductase NrfD [Desulfobacteraceae bacterium]|nr:polysulfide reductase NrfD [Desulfobacteraceae bacterium]